MLESTYIRVKALIVKVKDKIYQNFKIFNLFFLDFLTIFGRVIRKKNFDRCSGKRSMSRVRFNENEYKYA